jgi:hypothetical protein
MTDNSEIRIEDVVTEISPEKKPEEEKQNADTEVKDVYE